MTWWHKFIHITTLKSCGDGSERERSLIESLERWRGTPTDKQLAFLRNVFTRITRLPSAS